MVSISCLPTGARRMLRRSNGTLSVKLTMVSCSSDLLKLALNTDLSGIQARIALATVTSASRVMSGRCLEDSTYKRAGLSVEGQRLNSTWGIVKLIAA